MRDVKNVALPAPPGLLEREIMEVKNGRVLLIQASEQTAGAGTTTPATFWKQHLAQQLPKCAAASEIVVLSELPSG